MRNEQEALELLRREVEAQGKTFQRLPELEQLISHYQGDKLEQKREAINFDWEENGYACNAKGLVIGINLNDIQLGRPALLSRFRHLTWLCVIFGDVEDITWIASLTGLTELNLGWNQIDDVSPLAGLTGLTELHLQWNQIADVSPLAGLTDLTELHLQSNQIADVSPLASLTRLTRLGLWDNQITDVSPLTDLARLTILFLWKNQIADVSPLAGLTGLTELVLSDNQIDDVSPLAGLTRLTTLWLGWNQISDVSPLADLARLTTLCLWNNQIADVSPLAGLAGLTTLDLGSNQIADVSPLADLTGLTRLGLLDNQISDVSPLAALTQLKTLNLQKNKITTLPRTFAELDLEIHWQDKFSYISDTGMNLYDNPLESPPVAIVKQGWQAILGWFEMAEIQSALIAEFSYLQIFFEVSALKIDKYRCFLLTAEYLFSRLKHIPDLDGAAVIVEYAKIVDAILQKHVGEHLPVISGFKKPYMLRSWQELCGEPEYKPEYQRCIKYLYSRDPELIAFLINHVAQYTSEITRLRNPAAHTEVLVWDDAKRMRELLLEPQPEDATGLTLMEWLMRILYYDQP